MVKGEQQVVGLRLTNMTRYTAFQCDVVLPEGMTFAMNDQSSPTVSLGSANAQSHIIQANDIGNNGIRIVVMSMSNVAFSSENAVVNITVNADANEVGQKIVIIKNVRLVNVDQRTEFEAPTTQTTANIVEKRTAGDVNGDGMVDVTDIVGIANYILGRASSSFDATAADVNGDKVVDVTDIVAVANIILRGTGQHNANKPQNEDMLDPQ